MRTNVTGEGVIAVTANSCPRILCIGSGGPVECIHGYIKIKSLPPRYLLMTQIILKCIAGL